MDSNEYSHSYVNNNGGARTPDRKKITIVIAAIVLIALIICGSSCYVQVPTGHTGVITTFGKVENRTLEAGFHIKAPWQKVIKMDNRVQKTSVELNCFSSDIQEVKMIYTLNFQIDKANAQKIYASIGQDYASKILTPCITESVKTVTARYTAEKLVGDRNILAQGIEKELSEALRQYNIELVSASIEDIDFTDTFTNAVEAKQVAQQNKLRAQTEAEQKRIEAQAEADVKVIQAQAEADAQLVKAQAEAEANRLISESLTDEILQKLYYDVWDGKLPTTVLGGDSQVIMQLPGQADSAD